MLGLDGCCGKPGLQAKGLQGAPGALHLRGAVFPEIPLDTEQDVPAHGQAVSILLVVGCDRVGEAASLVKYIEGLDTQGEILNFLTHLGIPLVFRQAKALGVAGVEHEGEA